jgi:multidrug efflux pump
MEQITPFTEKIFRNFQSTPEFSHSFQLTFPSGGFGGMIVKPWEERTRSIFQVQQELFGKQMMLTGVQAPVFLPPALPSAGIFPVEFVIASTGSHEELVRAADEMVVDALKSGQFAFPPITDVKIDQAKADIVFDREKIASMGLSMQQVGADLATMLGGNYVNRFNMEGRSYKVIAQVERAAA